jgi:hypothetical protein
VISRSPPKTDIPRNLVPGRIAELASEGWAVVHQADDVIIFQRKDPFKWWLFIVLLIVFFPLALLQALVYFLKKSRGVKHIQIVDPI